MGIQVQCPHGHTFKVKDKYAGKRGLCPKCAGQVVVQVPEAGVSRATETAYRQAVLDEHKAAHAVPPAPGGSGGSVFDDHPANHDSGTSGSLLGSSVMRHNVKCACGASVPMWFAKCPSCGTFLQNR
ncbi:MAG: hypothetical protein AAGG46_04275 [Planctomycetota bacterium]